MYTLVRKPNIYYSKVYSFKSLVLLGGVPNEILSYMLTFFEFLSARLSPHVVSLSLWGWGGVGWGLRGSYGETIFLISSYNSLTVWSSYHWKFLVILELYWFLSESQLFSFVIVQSRIRTDFEFQTLILWRSYVCLTRWHGFGFL